MPKLGRRQREILGILAAERSPLHRGEIAEARRATTDAWYVADYMLDALAKRGLIKKRWYHGYYAWIITDAGRAALAATNIPK